MPARALGGFRRVLLAVLLVGAAPLTLAWIALDRLRGLFAPRVAPAGTGSTTAPAARRRTVLVTGAHMTKALALCRAFHRAGHRVVAVDTPRYRFAPARFARGTDRFALVPDPADGLDAHRDALLALIARERVDLVVPVTTPAGSLEVAAIQADLEAAGAEVVHPGRDGTTLLDDKERFCARARALGLPAPEVHRITSPDDLRRFRFGAGRHYVLKSIVYDPVARLDLLHLHEPSAADVEGALADRRICAERPWVLQEFVAGDEYCTHATVHRGRVTAWTCTRSSPFQVDYEHVEHPAAEAWCRRFAEATGLTGQISLDVIERDGEVLPIECNPRTHSAVTTFHDQPWFAASYCEPERLEAPVRPVPGSRPTWWLAHELARLAASRSTTAARAVLDRLRRGRDAVYARDDPWPFFVLHHLHVPALLLGGLRGGRPWIRVDFNIAKVVEVGGD